MISHIDLWVQRCRGVSAGVQEFNSGCHGGWESKEELSKRNETNLELMIDGVGAVELMWQDGQLESRKGTGTSEPGETDWLCFLSEREHDRRRDASNGKKQRCG